MKKMYFACLLIGLFLLLGCGHKEPIAKPTPVADMIGAGVFDREFTYIDLPGETHSTLPETSILQLDEDTLLFAQERGVNDDVKTEFILYDLTNGKVIRQLAVTEEYHPIMVRGDKIFVPADTGFYLINKDLEQAPEKLLLPQVMMANLCDKCRSCPRYDISDDLRYILYSCPENGMFLYDMDTAKNRRLFAGKAFPYNYQADVDFYQEPCKMFFLPGNEQFAIVTDNQETGQSGLWVFDFAGNLQGFVDDEEFGDMADLSSWHNPQSAPQPFSKTNHYFANGNGYVQSYVHRVDFQTQTADEWQKLDCPAGMVIDAFNENYFAYLEAVSDSDTKSFSIVVVDYATLTPRKVLQATNSWLQISGITEDGRVLFVWAPDIDSEYFAANLFIIGLTEIK